MKLKVEFGLIFRVLLLLSVKSEDTETVIEDDDQDKRIVNGTLAGPTEFPCLVSINEYTDIDKTKLKHICGGAIINEEWVLTSSNCIYKFKARPDKLIIKAGTNNNELDKGQVLSPEYVVVHPEFKENNKYGPNIGLIKLHGRFRYTGTVGFCVLQQDDSELPGGKIKISGWGRTNPSKTAKTKFLYTAEISISTYDECKRRIPKFNDDLICVLHSNKTMVYGEAGICRGDYGGPALIPIVYKYPIIYGINSYSHGKCARDYEIFVKVYNHLQFILGTMHGYR